MKIEPIVKSKDPDGFNRPFDALKELLQRKSNVIPAQSSPPRAAPSPAIPDHSEEEAFARAMLGVRRMQRERIDVGRAPATAPPARAVPDHDVAQLRRLVETGSGFVVCDTPEYIEGVCPHAPPGITQRLHRGEFAVQAHLDLHGLTLAMAHDLFNRFLRESIADGKRAVLVIHGRGLSSPGEPILKTHVAQWLSSGPWRRWVLAFASARMCDGGAGATYVLLRHRPLGKRQRRGKG